MKNVLLAILAVFTVAQAQARSIQTELNSELNNFLLQKGSTLESFGINSGKVHLDFVAKKISITLEPKFKCPEGAFCTQIRPDVFEFVADLKQIKTRDCGVVVYQALTNEMIVDGGLTKIEVVDNKKFSCKSYSAVIPTVVTLQTQNPRGQKETHKMYGDFLN